MSSENFLQKDKYSETKLGVGFSGCVDVKLLVGWRAGNTCDVDLWVSHIYILIKIFPIKPVFFNWIG